MSRRGAGWGEADGGHLPADSRHRTPDLNPPPDVLASTAEYRREEDPLRQFMDDCLTTGDGLQVTVSDVRNRYEAWCEDQGREPVSPRTLSRRLAEQYGETTTAWHGGRSRRVHQGVRITE